MPTATLKPKAELVSEEVLQTSKNISVDNKRGLIRGVKVIGFDSKNDRYYPPEVLEKAVSLYEGAKVNTNHPELKNARRPRRIEERFGVLRNAKYVKGRGIVADLHFNPKHNLAQQIAWDAENNPDAFGLSHNAMIKSSPRRKDGKVSVEEILSVKSVDVVADPATTKNIYESEGFNDQPEDVTEEDWLRRIHGSQSVSESQESLRMVTTGQTVSRTSEQVNPTAENSEDWRKRILS